jgi:nucleotide-binding universal stress UspA family protein
MSTSRSQPDSPVVVGVDGGAASAGALRYGVHEAVRRQVRLRLVHVMPFVPLAPLTPLTPYAPLAAGGPDTLGEFRTVAMGILAEARDTAAQVAPALPVETMLGHGSSSRVLVEAASQAQLVVVGRETRRGLDRLFVGATTAGVAARAACDVAVVPGDWTDEHPRGRVVVGIKDPSRADQLLGTSFAGASARGASLTFVTAWTMADPYLDHIEPRVHAVDWENQGRAALGELTADLRAAYPDVAVDVHIEHGRSARVLHELSRDSDLLVVGRHRYALHGHGHLGGVTYALLQSTEVPVLVAAPVVTPGEPPVLTLEEAGQLVR